jgi:hypothetical protein
LVLAVDLVAVGIPWRLLIDVARDVVNRRLVFTDDGGAEYIGSGGIIGCGH